MLSKPKPYIERFPTLAFAYRIMRAARLRQNQKAKSTPYGFSFIRNSAMKAGTFETEEILVIKKYLEDKVCLVDVSSNIGFYTCFARFMGKQCIAIEPLWQF